jgi:hypothetical protein
MQSAARGMPADATFAPPDDDIIHALTSGTAPALRLLKQTADLPHGTTLNPEKRDHETQSHWPLIQPADADARGNGG